jgi:sigma-54-specific transcriptional regulator
VLSLPTTRLRPRSSQLTAPSPSTSLDITLRNPFDQAPPKLYEFIEETVIRGAYQYCNRNQVQTARLLDISRNILRHRMAQYGINKGAAEQRDRGGYNGSRMQLAGDDFAKTPSWE